LVLACTAAVAAAGKHQDLSLRSGLPLVFWWLTADS